MRLESSGFDEAEAKARGFAGRVSMEMLKVMQQTIAFGHRFLAKYPPPPPNSTYTRTHTIEKKWTSSVKSDIRMIRGELGNNTPYVRYVQDELEQAKIHRGRWPTVQMFNERAPAKLWRKWFVEAWNRTIEWMKTG